ncbi:hypothetical protein [Streptomyces sp. TLI_171]|uniref:hypothetical protein n=1 Tax=Streptomyces sp. TLI_171 TaxID=1938859 RepID=UPI000C44CDD8|nr:hypothetical protein [Streptomyces sp. TLI_171]RKE03015.1 hypothetical protein BX266_7622 [Streptomyces sp. TLI_171]
MSDPLHAPPATVSTAGETAELWRVAVLSVWHPALGAPLDPVAVVGFGPHLGGDPAVHLVWVPLAFEAADPWRELLADGVTVELLDHWAERSATVAVDYVDVPEGAVALSHAVGLLLDLLLAEVLPNLPDRGEG